MTTVYIVDSEQRADELRGYVRDAAFIPDALPLGTVIEPSRVVVAPDDDFEAALGRLTGGGVQAGPLRIVDLRER